jgi:tetratricopeptide (TPR) repeat protein
MRSPFALLTLLGVLVSTFGPARRACHGQVNDPQAGVRDAFAAGVGESQEPGVGWAVLIAPENYKQARPLDYCEEDVLVLADALIRSGGFRADHIWFLGNDDTNLSDDKFYGLRLPARENCGRKAEISDIKFTLREVMGKTKPGDTLLIAFSGHGVLDEAAESYLLPLPGYHSPPDPEIALHLDSLLEQLQDKNKCRASRKIVLLDACHSGGLKFSVPEVTAKTSEYEKLGTDREGRGTLVISSCAGDEVSHEYPRDDQEILRQGVFSYFLAQAFRGEVDVDLNPDGSVTAVEAFIYTRDKVQDFVKAKGLAPQCPQWRVVEGNANFKIATTSDRSTLATNLDIQAFTPTSGAWWFDETPELVPRLRLHLGPPRTIALRVVHGAIDSVDLESMASSLIGQVPKTDNLVGLGRLRDKSARRTEICNDLIQELSPQPDKAAVDLHLLAVLYDQTGQYAKAAATFQEALKEYGAPSAKSQRGLYSLCHADYAKSLHNNKDYNAAINNYELAYKKLGNNVPPTFKIYCLCRQADIHRERGEWEDAASAIKEAEPIARSLPNKGQLAYVLERSAWLEMDRWNVEHARANFANALELRTGDLAQGGGAEVAVLQDKHGQLVAERFAAKMPWQHLDQQYDRLIKEIQEQLKKETSATGKRALLTRLANTYERAADPHVFASNLVNLSAPTSKEIQERLSRAVRRLGDARRTLQLSPLLESQCRLDLPRLENKLAISYALLGHSTNASVRLEEAFKAQQVLPTVKGDDAAKGDHALAYHAIAKAVVELLNCVLPASAAQPSGSASSVSIVDQQAKLRAAIRLMYDGQGDLKLQRDHLELMLFASGLLAASHTESQGRLQLPDATRKEDITFFSSIANALNKSPPQLRRYLRPYFTVAIRSTVQCDKFDYVEAARLILTCKYGEPFNYGDPAILFHIDERGIVALVGNGDEWQMLSDCVALDGTRRAKAGDNLRKVLQRFSESSAMLQIIWSDPDLNIGDDQFPDLPDVMFQLLPTK